MKQKLFTLFFALVASVGTMFAAVVIDGIAYNLNDETFTAEVTSGGAYTGEVVIPSSITYNQQVYSVTSIGNYAFQYCSGLTSVSIGNSVTSIGNSAFYYCTVLTSMTIPEGVASIGSSAFDGCTNIKSVTWNAKNCKAYKFGNQVESFTFGNEVEVIPASLCSGMNKLTSITIPNSVTSIGNWAFSNCTGLTSVTIPNGVTSIGDGAFYGCTNLISITIPNSVTSIGGDAFYGCTGLTSVTIGNSVTSIGNYAFAGCSSLTSVTIGNSVTSIGYDAFYGCSGLTSPIYNSNVFAYLPPSYSGAFAIPNGIELIARGAFYGCSELTLIIIPNSVTSIGNYAFSGCSGLTSVTIPNSVTSIGHYAFSGCTGLTSVTIPNSVTSIGYYAFYGCTGLTSVTIPNSVTSIGGYAFYGCTGLTSIIIPEGVTSIGNYLFGYCSNLKTIELPSTIVFNEYNYNYNIFGTGESYNVMPQLDTIRIAAGMLSSEEKDTTGYYHSRFTLAGFYKPNYNPAIDNYDNTSVALQNVKYVEAPYWFFDVPEDYWTKCPKSIEHVVVNRGELNDNILGVISRSYKTLKSLDVSAVTNVEFADEAFKGFYNLQTLALPEDLQRVSYMMVAGCKNLKSIDIPASVEEIDQSAFEDCRSLQTITFGGKQPAAVSGKSFARAAENSQLKRIGNWAFYNAHELQHLEIPESVEEIGDAAFYGCVYLEDLVLPSSVQSIGDNCFALCSKLNKIIVSATTPPTIQAKTFYDVKRQIPVYVPDDCVDAYESDQYWSEFNIQGKSNIPTSLEDLHVDADKAVKVLKDGQIYILRGDKTYTITGQEIK